MESDRENMQAESVLYGITGDVLSKSEVFFLQYKATSGKEVYTGFEQFKTDGVDMAELDHLRM